MTEHTTAPTSYAGGSSRPTPDTRWDPQDPVWKGWVVFACVMMALIGFSHVLQGLVAIFDDEYFVVRDSGLAVAVDYTAWGWTHLVLGGVVLIAGLNLYSGARWARAVGVVVAAISVVLSFGFLAASPAWSTIMIAMAVLVILALTVRWNA